MDRHAMMWNEATRDIDTERAETALAYALADLDGVRNFTHVAAGPVEYRNRAALTAHLVQAAAATHGTTPTAIQDALDASFGHVLAARHIAAAKLAKTAASAPAAPPMPQQQTPPVPASPAPGAPTDILAETGTAKTSKPRTLPTGSAPAPAPMPGMPPGPSAGPTPGPGAQAAPATHTASRRQIIEADIAALNPHLPAATITRLATTALRHLAAEPLAYGNWDNPADGPITDTVKNWKPGGGKAHPGTGGGGADTSGPAGTPDPAPAGPAAAASAAEEVIPLLAAAAQR